MQTFIVGLSLGQAQDTTALCILEQTKRATGDVQHGLPSPIWYEDGRKMGGHVDTYPVYESNYAVRHLERLAAGTPYPEQVSKTNDLVSRLEKQNGRVSLIVDQTGVGRPVTDMLRVAKLRPKAAVVTGGDTPSQEGNEYRIPKRDLVSSAQILLQSKRLTIASSLPLAQALVGELLAFKASITLSRENSSAPPEPWRERTHDDLVLAVALAAWYGESSRTTNPKLAQRIAGYY
jgi:hypothetical protein